MISPNGSKPSGVVKKGINGSPVGATVKGFGSAVVINGTSGTAVV